MTLAFFKDSQHHDFDYAAADNDIFFWTKQRLSFCQREMQTLPVYGTSFAGPMRSVHARRTAFLLERASLCSTVPRYIPVQGHTSLFVTSIPPYYFQSNFSDMSLRAIAQGYSVTANDDEIRCLIQSRCTNGGASPSSRYGGNNTWIPWLSSSIFFLKKRI